MKLLNTTAALLVSFLVAGQGGPAEASQGLCAGARSDALRTVLTERYVELVCRAEAAFAAGDYDSARTALIRAAREPLFEVPNYEPLVMLAEIDCLQGRTDSGLGLLAEVGCMLDVEIGEKQCFPDDPDDETGGIGPDVSYLCFVEMCAPIYLSYYESPSPETYDHVAAMRLELARVRRNCQSG